MNVTSKEVGFELTNDSIAALVAAQIIPAGTPPAQIEIFARICAEKRLSPFSRHIYLLKVQEKFATITGIDGYRILADRSGKYAGCDNPIFDLKSDGSFKSMQEVINSGKLPDTCTVTVYKMLGNTRVPFTKTVAFREFNKNQLKWLTMPIHMICIKAEAHALKSAFSEETSGLEMAEDAELVLSEEDNSISPILSANIKKEDTVADSSKVDGERALLYANLAIELGALETEKEIRDHYRKNRELLKYDGDAVVAKMFSNRINEIKNN